MLVPFSLGWSSAAEALVGDELATRLRNTAASLRGEVSRWAKVIKDAGLKAAD